jgi:hypothetical protein
MRVFQTILKANIAGKEEGVSLPRRLLLIKNIRRDSFLLTPRDAS